MRKTAEEIKIVHIITILMNKGIFLELSVVFLMKKLFLYRTIGSLIQFQFFKLIPRNRNIESTFKINSAVKVCEMNQSGEFEKLNSSMHSYETRIRGIVNCFNFLLIAEI